MPNETSDFAMRMLIPIIMFLLSATCQSLAQRYTSGFRGTEPGEPQALDPCPSGCVEVIIHSKNAGTGSHTYKATSQGIRWDDSFNLTTDYQSISVTFSGDQDTTTTSPWGWDFVFSDNCSKAGGVLAYGLYKIWVEGDETYFYLDYRDSRYANGGSYGPIDVWIRFDFAQSSWYWNSWGCKPSGWVSIDNNATVGIWEIFDVGSPSTAKFQPTDPTNLSISNSGGHPYLSWTGSAPSTALYHVYRSESQTSGWSQRTTSALSTTHWTDEHVQISGPKKFYYKVRALSGDENKWSVNYSNVDSCTGQYIEEKAAVTADRGTPKSGQLLRSSSFPNPFNPATRIRYSLPSAGHVHLLVYDLMGRELVRLVDGDLGAGEQEALWKGEDASGRLVPSGTYIYELQHGGRVGHGKLLLVR